MESETFVCRTCLASSVKLYKLDEPFTRSMGGCEVQKEARLSFSECLNYCTRLDDMPSFPNYICEECSHALQIAYYFIQNALKAHEILAQRLGITHCKQELTHENAQDEAVMRFRCKICNEKVETRRALKEHIKLHMDVITYCCQMCDYDCKKRSQLSDHYSTEHNVEATSEQLKPYMHSDLKTEEQKIEMERQIAEIFAPSEQRQREQEEAELFLQELEEKILKERQQEEQLQQSLQVKDEDDAPHQNILLDSTDVLNAAISETFEGDVSIGNEFVVMPDGTVQKVVGSDVVIEYINQDVNGVPVLESNNLLLENVLQMDTNNSNLDSMDFEDIIEDATSDFQQTVPLEAETSSTKHDDPEALKGDESIQLQDERTLQPQLTNNLVTVSKKLQCKICTKTFQTQQELKTHMLSHSEIPHFFCDRCAFYTFFKKDLTQHYRTKHNIQPSQRQLQPTNKPEETPPKLMTKGRAVYSCDLCLYETTIRVNLQRHYMNQHRVVATEVQLRPTIDNTDVDIRGYTNVRAVKSLITHNSIACTQCKAKFYSPAKYEEHLLWHEKKNNKIEDISIPEAVDQNSQEYVEVEEKDAKPLEGSNNNIDDMILPMDAVPQVVGSEQTIEHTTNFDFNGEEIFEDFDDNNESIGDEQEDDDLGDLLLTSEDDLDDLLEEHGNDDKIPGKPKSAPQLRAYCVHCNKRFFSQYHFENHMFIHRGLAPYRCEMCTNLYNTKRALIRHYKAVHKTLPTRDMIQAKGDKVNVDKTLVEHLNMEEEKRSTVMCAKCPFESNELNDLLMHLSTSHGITDDNYILQKLPFECPRCIRSYESKASLMRHLERSHSVATIIQNVTRRNTHKKSSTSNTSNISSLQDTTSSTSVNSTATSPRCGIVESPLKSVVQQELFNSDKDAITLIENNLTFDCPNSLLSEEKQMQENAALYECSICQGRYKSESLLRIHIKRHIERKFLCDLCPKSFICRADLDNHKLLHASQITGQLPYKCDLCDKQFGYPHHLKRHKEVLHYGKRFTCPIVTCGKSFTTRAQYNIHKLNHAGNQPYKCKFCDRCFCKRDTFRQHCRKIHNANLTEAEIAEIFRENTGHTNPHDLIVALDNGQMLRRSEAETMALNCTDVACTRDG